MGTTFWMCIGCALLGALGLRQKEPGMTLMALFACTGSLGAAIGLVTVRLLGWDSELVGLLFLTIGFFGGGCLGCAWGSKYIPE